MAAPAPATSRVKRPRTRGYGGGPGARSRPKMRAPEDWEVEVMRLLSEQGPIPIDQLARFLRCDARAAERISRHLGKAGFAAQRRFLADQPPWVWLTPRGARLSGTGLVGPTPGVGLLPRARAVNEVRLLIAKRAPEARWISHRLLGRQLGREGHIPNGVIEIGDERHAIEVELIQKTKARAVNIIDAHHARYDAVVCFCVPSARRLLERLKEGNHWPKLIIRDLPLG